MKIKGAEAKIVYNVNRGNSGYLKISLYLCTVLHTQRRSQNRKHTS